MPDYCYLAAQQKVNIKANMLKIGVFGTGHLGKIHIQQWKEVPGIVLKGFYEPDDEKAAAVAREFGIERYTSMDALIDQTDALDIVSTTITNISHI